MASLSFYIENNSAYTIKQETYFLSWIDKDNHGVITHGYTGKPTNNLKKRGVK